HAPTELKLRVAQRRADLAHANTELREVNEQLSRRTKEAAQKSEEVEAFVYVVSHDLRAPLVNLQGFSKELATSCRELDAKIRTAAISAPVQTDIAAIGQDISSSLRYI